MVPWALDRNVRFVTGEGPKLDPMKTGGEITEAMIASMAPRLTPVATAISNCRAALAVDKALIGFAGAPWTIDGFVRTWQTNSSGSPQAVIAGDMTLALGAEIAQQSPEVQVNGTFTNIGTYRAIGSAFGLPSEVASHHPAPSRVLSAHRLRTFYSIFRARVHARTLP